MKIKKVLFLVMTVVALASCGNHDQSLSATISDSSPQDDSSDMVQQPSIQEVFDNIKDLKNYTYTNEDQIFNVTTTISYTEKAYYYHPSQKEHGGEAKGYAQSSDNQVFGFTLDDDNKVVPGDVVRDKNGVVNTDLWNQTIISFADFNIAALPDEPLEDNIYEITDDANKLLFAALAGYGDTFVMSYITVSVEVLSETTFRTTVHFEPENNNYVGDCIGTLSNVGTTSLPEIETYLANGGGPKVDEAGELYALLEKVKNSKQYQIDVKSSNSSASTYQDILNENYTYSKSKPAFGATTEKGYLTLANSIYNYTIDNGAVNLGSEITYTSSDHSDLWSNISIKSFKNLNLSNVKFTKEDSGAFSLDYSVSSYGTLLNLLHLSEAFPNVDSGDKVEFKSDFTDDSFAFVYHRNNSGAVTDYTVTVTLINSAKQETVEKFISDNKNYDPSDISSLKDKFSSLKESKNYSIEVTDKVSSFASGYNKGDKLITFSDNNYYLENKTVSTESIGYKKDGDSIYSYVLKDGNEEKKEDIQNKMDIWDGLFSSFKDITDDEVKAEKSPTGVYTIKDTNLLKKIYSIIGYDSEKLISYSFTSASITLTDKGFDLSAKSSFYGSFSATVLITK